MKYLLLILFPIFLFSNEIAYDYNIFEESDNIYELIYNFSVPSKYITYKQIEGKLTGKIEFNIVLKNMNNDKFVKDNWTSTSYISNEEKINREMLLLDQSLFRLSPGNYEISIVIMDLFSSKKYAYTDTLHLKDIPSAPHISNLMFGITVKKDSSNGKFTRNGYAIIPNPSATTSILNPLLYFYTEYYKFPDNKKYRIMYKISQDNDTLQEIKGDSGFTYPQTFFNISAINTAKLKDGKYTITLQLSYDSTTINTSREFFKSSSISHTVSNKYHLSDREFKYFDKIEYIASSEEISKYKSLSEKGKYNFLIYFWEARDPDTTNNKLEALDEYIKNIEFVNKKYSTGNETGYDSPRGRIYLKYGVPDEELTVPSSTGYQSYESWIYYNNGGMQFIFADIKGYGKYELIYSSEIDEDIPYNWQNYIDTDIIRFKRD